MQLHIPEAEIKLSENEGCVIILGDHGTITLTGIYAEKFKRNYATHFDNAVAAGLWEHPTVTFDLSLSRLRVAAH